MDIKKLKRSIKSAGIVAAALLGGSHTSIQAQETNTQHKMEYTQNKEPKYSFNDDESFELLNSTLSESTKKNSSDLKSLMHKYIEKMDNYYSKDQKAYNLTMSDYTNVLEEIGCTRFEVVKGKKAFMEKAQAQEKHIYQPQMNKLQHESMDSPIHVVDGGNVSYYTDKGELHISGKFSGSIEHLLPSIQRTSDGSYQCGSSIDDNKSHVLGDERRVINRLAMEHLVYKDIMQRQKQGDHVLPAEQGFVQDLPQRLAEEGLSITDKGNLKQKNPYKTNQNLRSSQQKSY